MRSHPSRLVVALSLLAASCTGLDRNDQGVLQPQSVQGPCQVKKFYLLALTAVHTDMTVGSSSEACRFTILNPDLQAFPTAALVTRRPSHGLAIAELVAGGRQVLVSYTPQPGTPGRDGFTITIEPADHAVAVDVTVQ